MPTEQKTVPTVTVDLLHIPRSGDSKMILRMRPEDMEAIQKACDHIGLTQAQFLRASTINAAKAVLRE